MSNLEAVRRYQERNRNAVRERGRTYHRMRRQRDPEGVRARERERYAGHPGYTRAKGFRRYGLSVVQWLAMFHFQGACCAICKGTDPGTRGWATDHDHETGAVRGILCHRCNLCLGWLGDTGALVTGRLNMLKQYLGI